jgi:hypothetical protein|tara:strand:- start:214 stop:492 length:279 start_codon:yes stop_codon:yes gene_type:complete
MYCLSSQVLDKKTGKASKMAKVKNDYTVSEWHNVKGEQRWRVLVGGGDVVTVCHSLEKAQHIAKNMNIDPWFLDRGNTRADRVAAYNKNYTS